MEAALPLEPLHTAVGAEMVAAGSALIATSCEPVAEQLAPLTTVTPRATVPAAPLAKVIAWVPTPEVIVPLVIDQV
jgi:ascorbate-specific PTS system EIIC-type component UlaA